MSISDRGKTPPGHPNLIYPIVSKSIEEQNKYLYNYIHKLEFLLTQSHEERASSALKFKRVFSHIVHQLSGAQAEPGSALQALKRIQMMESVDANVHPTGETSAIISEKKDFVLEALAGGSKPFNNYESGYERPKGIKTQASPRAGGLEGPPSPPTEGEEDPYGPERAKVERLRRL